MADQIDEVLIVGGKAKSAKIREALKPLFRDNLRFVDDINQKTAVVLGAAELADFFQG